MFKVYSFWEESVNETEGSLSLSETRNELNEVEPKVTVIVPTCNYGSYLAECLISLIEQTLESWECFIIDDGSTDNTRQVVDQFLKKDHRIKYIYQDNSGPNTARNKGIALANGSYIQLLDADDMLEKNKIQNHVGWLDENPDVHIVYSHHRVFRKEGESMEYLSDFNTPKNSGKGMDIGHELLKAPFTINSPLIRKSVFEMVGPFDQDMKYNEDWMYWLRCMCAGVTFYFADADQARALVRRHGANATGDFWKTFYYRIDMRNRFEKMVNNDELKEINRKWLAHDKDFLVNLAIEERSKTYWNGNRKLLSAFRLNPAIRTGIYLVLGILGQTRAILRLQEKSFS